MAGTLKVKVEENIILDNQDYSSKRILTVSSINEIFKRIVSCPANNETTLVHFHSSVADGTLSPVDIDEVKYIRVTNLDSSNSLTLSLQSDVGEDDSAADESASLLVEAGRSFVMGSPNDGIGISDANANLVTDLVDLESLVVQPGSSAINVEVFVAST
jgi:hypothetical protein|tara:strand:+ start:352 stop:828 length:477 start_codon:yes stop_codon:yes gene_type:complete